MNGRNEAFAEVEALTRSVMTLDEKLDRIERGAGSVNSSASQVNVNGGTWVSYIALSLVLVTLAVVALACLFIAFQLSDLRRQDETFQAYINAGYVQPETKEAP